VAQLKANPWYLWAAFLLPAVISFTQSVAPLEPTFKAQNLAVIFGVAGAIGVTVLWIPFQTKEIPSKMLRLMLSLIVLAWVIQTVLSLVDGYVPNHTTYFLPLLMILIYIKPPTREGFLAAGLVLGYSLTAIVVVSLFLGGHFGIPNGFEVSDNGESRFPLVSQLLGIETRWGGPFGSVNYATPVGGLLVMLSVFYRRWNRWIFVVVGLVVLFLGQARTTYFALAIALLVLVLWSNRFGAWRLAHVARWVVSGLSVVAFTGYIAVIDPSFNGRTPIWADYWIEVQESFLTGIGSSGVAEYVIQASTIDPSGIYHLHAHSVYLDGLTRYGLLWLLVTLCIFAVAFRQTWVTRTGVAGSRGIAMVTFLFLTGSTETIYSWAYVTIYVLALVYVVGLTRSSQLAESSQEVSSPVQN